MGLASEPTPEERRKLREIQRDIDKKRKEAESYPETIDTKFVPMPGVHSEDEHGIGNT